MIRGLSGTAINIDIADNESGLGREEDGQLQGHVKDLEHGVKQGGKVGKTPVSAQCFFPFSSRAVPAGAYHANFQAFESVLGT